jgi:hypothetical protein
MVTARITPAGTIGQVTVTSPVRTLVADPKFRPKPNVAISEIVGVDVQGQQNGYTLLYDAESDNYVASPIDSVNVRAINGGSF